MNIATEITLSTIIELGTVLVGGILAYADLKGRMSQEAEKVKVLDGELRRAHSRITDSQRELAEYKERQARELVTREMLRDVTTPLTEHIDKLAEKIDDMKDRLPGGRGAYPAS